MPTIFSHAFFASALGSAFAPKHQRGRFAVLTALCAILPDADVISFAFGVNYRSVLGHRGITHSLVFALLVGGLVAAFCFRGLEVSRWKLAAYFSIVTFSHPLLDMLTNGGLGVALFAPFSEERFFFPWRPVRVSPIGVGFFSERGLAVILSELIWIWLPSIAIAIVFWTIRLASNRNSAGAAADSPAEEHL
jgi:inner membrane protein